MRDLRTPVLRHIATAILVFVLTLAGAERGLVAAPDASSIMIAGFVAPICHTQIGGAPGPDSPRTGHDCCDDCALCAPVVLPAAPALSGPTPVVLAGRLRPLDPSPPQLARSHTPRQSQGPPVA